MPPFLSLCRPLPIPSPFSSRFGGRGTAPPAPPPSPPPLPPVALPALPGGSPGRILESLCRGSRPRRRGRRGPRGPDRCCRLYPPRAGSRGPPRPASEQRDVRGPRSEVRGLVRWFFLQTSDFALRTSLELNPTISYAIVDAVRPRGRKAPWAASPSGAGPVLRELVFAPVAEKLAEVERRIQVKISSRADLISEVTNYVLGGGGKRVRPGLLLLCARMCGYDGGERDVDLAVVAEFMHAATLIHDDIIDNAPKRRGRPSALARWGPHVSVLAGAFFSSPSIQRLVGDGDFQVLKAFADATVAMTEGEILELRGHRNPDVLHQDYLTIITR